MKSAERRDAMNASRGVPCQVLTFSLGTEEFGVDILSVREIRGWTPVTRIPQAPAGVLGVLDLRGRIVPIVDLHVRLNLAPVEFTPLTVIIVISHRTATGLREFGIVVDAVADVVDLDASAIKPPPEWEGGGASNCIRGLGVKDARMLILLNVETLTVPSFIA